MTAFPQEGKDFLERTKHEMEIVRLKPEKDDSDTQSAVNLAIRQGAKDIEILGVTGTQGGSPDGKSGTAYSAGRRRGVDIRLSGSV